MRLECFLCNASLHDISLAVQDKDQGDKPLAITNLSVMSVWRVVLSADVSMMQISCVKREA